MRSLQTKIEREQIMGLFSFGTCFDLQSRLASHTFISFKTCNTFKESYNLPLYILEASSDNKSKSSTNFSFIQRMNSCQNS